MKSFFFIVSFLTRYFKRCKIDKVVVPGYIFLFSFLPCYAQKPALDTSVFRSWPKVGVGTISDDGKYIGFEIDTISFGDVKGRTVILQSRRGDWKMEFNHATSNISFSPDSKVAILKLAQDSLALIATKSKIISYIPGVSFFRIVEDYLIYSLKDDIGVLKVRHLTNNAELSIDNVRNYDYVEKLHALLLNKIQAGGKNTVLSLFSLQSKTEQVAWEGQSTTNIKVDPVTGNIAFIENNPGNNNIWLYKPGSSRAQLILNGRTDSLTGIFQLSRFSKDGTKLYFITRQQAITADVKRENENVAIWSYKDPVLKSEQKLIGARPVDYIYVIDLNTLNVISLTKNNELIEDRSNAFALISQKSGHGNIEEADWNPSSQVKYLLVSLKNGDRTTLPFKESTFSRGGRFILYYDYNTNDYFTYEISSGKIVNVTAGIKAIVSPSAFYKDEFTTDHNYLYYWEDNDSALILYAQRDMWQVDPLGIKRPVNITNGYGAKHNIAFYPVAPLSKFGFQTGEKLLVMAFNYSNKENGFYHIIWGKGKDPQEITMGKQICYMPLTGIENGFDNAPIKARRANVWLVKRMSESTSPNLFTTSDFKQFQPISDIYPERKYNWMRSELFTFKLSDGDSAQGILYKPEDFDKNKKYPILFHYYEQFSNNLHGFLDPRASGGPINIPWYVSHGYLVFVPDIHFKEGETGANAFDAVVSAASLLSKQPYVDSTKMGIQGHSFGGYETNYIVTHTGIFAAACTSSGLSDLVSFSGGIGGLGTSLHYMASKGQLRLTKKLWEDPQRFIRNSPIFFLDRVTTPLLMMHTTNDRAVAFSQAIEIFNGLRQLKKKVWLLIYEGEDHVLGKESHLLDYTLRQTQFFDYYLKGMPQPGWMK